VSQIKNDQLVYHATILWKTPISIVIGLSFNRGFFAPNVTPVADLGVFKLGARTSRPHSE
jgi:hypothetical protein